MVNLREKWEDKFWIVSRTDPLARDDGAQGKNGTVFET